MDIKRIALMASGRGSNALSLIDFAKEQEQLEICLLICDRDQALVIEKAKRAGIEVRVVVRLKDETRSQHEDRMVKIMRDYQVEWVCLAGFMRILSKNFLQNFYDQELGQYRVINIHPSLLPAYPGKDAYQRIFADGVLETGVTVHFVDEGMDSGRIIAQRKIKRDESDSLEQFIQKGLEQEHQLYREVLGQLARDTKLLLKGR